MNILLSLIYLLPRQHKDFVFFKQKKKKKKKISTYYLI
jgi:hypothetical protein